MDSTCGETEHAQDRTRLGQIIDGLRVFLALRGLSYTYTMHIFVVYQNDYKCHTWSHRLIHLSYHIMKHEKIHWPT